MMPLITSAHFLRQHMNPTPRHGWRDADRLCSSLGPGFQIKRNAPDKSSKPLDRTVWW